MSRHDQLASALNDVSKRLANACQRAGRNLDEVTLLPVTKFFPATDVAILHALGCREFGESREPEASHKVTELTAIRNAHWHMIGRVQRNKARAIVGWAFMVHSVDSPRLAQTLDTVAAAALDSGARSEPLPVLLQVSLDLNSQRGGVSPAELGALADIVAGAEALRLAGVMAIPPLGIEPERAFAQLATAHEELMRAHPDAVIRSAGMSDDLEIAVEYGSTCVRVGTALMGARPIISAQKV